MRKTFIETLPKDKRGRVDWLSSENNLLSFVYDEIEGKILLGDYNKFNRKIKIMYEDFSDYINTSHLLNGKLGNIVNKTKNINMSVKEKWNTEEEQTLIDNYEYISNEDLKLLLPKRSISSILTKARHLNLIKNDDTLSKSKSKGALKRNGIDYVSLGFNTYEEYINFKSSNKYIKNLATAFKEYKNLFNKKQLRFSNGVVNKNDVVILFKYYLRKNNIDMSKENLLKQNYSKLCEKSKLDNYIQKHYIGYYDFICTCFPKYNFKIWEFKILDCPNNYWNDKYNMFYCIRECIESMFKQNIISNYSELFQIPQDILVNYFHSSVAYFGNGLKNNIITYLDFIKADYKIDKLYDGILFDSIEEIYVYKQLKCVNKEIIKNTKMKFKNEKYNESYIPDFIIGDNIIVEYFGMYNENHNSKIYKRYTQKANRKIKFFESLKGFIFIPIYPNDIYKNRIKNKLIYLKGGEEE